MTRPGFAIPLLLAMVLVAPAAPAAPGDILFSDDFERNALGAAWTVDNSGGGDAGISNATASSPTRSLFTRWRPVTVTSTAINLAVPGAELQIWVRRGADSFSEDPDSGEDLVLEFLASDGTWVELERFTGAGTPGEIFTRTYTLPSSALHAGFRLRLRQANGSGSSGNGGQGWDYWHVDDVVITETAAPPPPPPVCSPALFEDGFESGLLAPKWTEAGAGGDAGVGAQTAATGTYSMFTRWGQVTVTSIPVDLSAQPAAQLSVWVRRGDDAFSEDPDNNEDLVLEFLDNGGGWTALETFPGNGTPGEIFNRSYALPGSALHAGFRLRFRQTGGSGPGWDYWHVDDVCLQTMTPPAPVAWYRMDEAGWNGTAGEVTDSSGNGNHGTAVGTADTAAVLPAIPGDPGTCGYGEIPFNDTAAAQDAVDTGVDVNNIGNAGTISFWYKGNRRWGQPNRDRQLLDASTDTIGNFNDKYFFLVMRDRGRLRFALEDSNDGDFLVETARFNFARDQWVYITVTWDLAANVLQIYVNGSLAQSATIGSNGTLGDLTTLYAGDNRGNYLVSGATARSADGSIDELRIYSQVLSQAQIQADMNATHPCSAVLDHFEITHNVDALTCEPLSVTLTAHDAAHNVLADYTGTVQLSTSTSQGDWQLTGVAGDAWGTLTPGAPDSGQATYVFLDDGDGVNDDDGQVTLALKNTHAGPLTITAADAAAGVASTGPTVTFRPYGFRTTPDPMPTQVSGRPFTFTLTAVGQPPTDAGCTVIEEYTGNQSLAMWSDYNDPADNPYGSQVGVTVAAGSYTLGTSEAAATSVTVNFTNGVSEAITAVYPDAGAIRINAKDEINVGAPPAGSGTEIVVGGGSFVVRPFGFHLSGLGYSDPLPAAPNPAGPVLVKAGAPFSVGLRAVAWQAADDSGSNGGVANDGVPDPGADLSDNSTTQNFGRESAPPLVDLTHVLAAPAGGNPGTLGGGSGIGGFTGGAASASLSYDEVGIIHLTAALRGGDYLGGGQDVTTTAYNVGRFYPDHFSLANPLLTNRSGIAGCTDAFTYMDEPFNVGFELRAENAGGATTLNYTGAFAKLDPTVAAQMNYGATDSGTDYTARLVVAGSGVFNNGVANAGADLRLTRNTAPDGPLAALAVGVAPVDSDGVILDAYDLSLDGGPDTHRKVGQTEVRFGRLAIENAYGSEFLPLGVPLYAQFWTGPGTGFALNTGDNCTPTAIGALRLDNNVETNQTDGDIQIQAGATTSASLGDGNGALAGTELGSGDAALSFTAPNVTGYTDITVDASAIPYLRFDWDGDGNHDNDPPTARATFGSFRGDDRIIYWQECFGLDPGQPCP